MISCKNWPKRVKMLKNFGWKYHDGLWPYWDRDNSKHLEKDLQRISDNKFLDLLEDEQCEK